MWDSVPVFGKEETCVFHVSSGFVSHLNLGAGKKSQGRQSQLGSEVGFNYGTSNAFIELPGSGGRDGQDWPFLGQTQHKGLNLLLEGAVLPSGLPLSHRSSIHRPVPRSVAELSCSPSACRNGLWKKAEGRNNSLLFLSLLQPLGISIDRISYEANIMSLTMSEITQLLWEAE